MADNFSFCLIGAMDSLWFHEVILFSEPFSLYFPKTLKPRLPYSEYSTTTTTTSPSSSLSLSSLAEDISTAVCPLLHQGNSAIPSPLTPLDDSKNEEEVKKRPTRVTLNSSRSRSHSSSPSTQKRQIRNHRLSTSGSLAGKLQKSTSCRSLKDLELEEVKGFMDLGFIFKKEHLNARMISVLPGVLRLGFFKTELNRAADELPKDDDIEQGEGKGVIRPYLSEAWLIKRPDSPLLNIRVPRVTAAADMKKHLKLWARTVVSVVQQEC
ncbi:uncharacterized protein LOC111295761 [Durio zibethinus]|uniref:Uncharacterized protein LOC111295761 n=1 Tax=Durio zibethinus TaxID=66656 RepID=A0A6P5YY73_DURZI|nr:uncharacterized protein LOC111295761 [Durio zibethinus]